MKFIFFLFSFWCLILQTFSQEDVPIIADKVSKQETLDSVTPTFEYCFSNNRQGDVNAYQSLRAAASHSKLESGKTFIYCVMRRLKWLDDKGEFFLRGKILADIENGFRASSGTLSAKMPLEALVRQCLQGFEKEEADFSYSFAIARCLYTTGIQPIPELYEILTSENK